MNSTRLAAVALVVLGAGAIALGIAGAAGDWGSSSQKVTLTAATPKAAASTTTTVPPETPQQFVVELSRALKNNDVAFLTARLHPEVILRYGRAQCGAFVESFRQHRVEQFTVVGTPAKLANYAWTTDGATTNISGVYAVPVTVNDGIATSRSTVHTIAVDGAYRYFTDCGSPRS